MNVSFHKIFWEGNTIFQCCEELPFFPFVFLEILRIFVRFAIDFLLEVWYNRHIEGMFCEMKNRVFCRAEFTHIKA